MIELRGEKVVLRTLERKDCRRLWEEYEPESPLPSEPLTPGLSAEGADKWFEEMQVKQGKEQVYLGIFTSGGELLGDIQLAHIDWRNRTATVGYGISRKQNRGKGYATDAVRVLARFAFEELDLYRLSVNTAAHNTAACRVLEKCGFVKEGCARLAVYCGGRRWDQLTYGLLRTELAAAQRPTQESSKEVVTCRNNGA
jgi:RimJ/RimL family protein N-acetyltransferase